MAFRKWFTGLVAVSIVAVAGVAFAADEDQVVLKQGNKATPVPIVEMTIEGVTYTIAGAGKSMYTWDKIASVKLGGAVDLNKAIDQLAANSKLEEASSTFSKLAADEKARVVIRQEAMYHLGLARQRLNDGDGAVKAYKDLLAKFPKSRYLRNAGENMLSLLLAKRDIDGAAKAFSEITASAKAAGAADAVLGPLAILQGRILEAQGRFPDAQSSYEKVASGSQDPGTALAAKLGAARCVLASGKPDDAERRFREITKDKTASTIVLAGAWNGLGDVYIEAGAKARDGERVRDALFAYLRGVVQYVAGSDEPGLRGSGGSVRWIP